MEEETAKRFKKNGKTEMQNKDVGIGLRTLH